MSGSLLIRSARIVTPVPLDRSDFLRGPDQGGRVRVIERADVRIRDGVIVEIVEIESGLGRAASDSRRTSVDAGEIVVDAAGSVLMPGFVDAHTHLCWAGERLGEWELRLRGASYEEILAAGGGILSTVAAVRAASEEELAGGVASRLARVLREGTTTIEVKSGYGLEGNSELRMLHAIRRAAGGWPGTVVPTALLGHAVDPEYPGGPAAFVDHVASELLPRVTREFPEAAVDAFCEKGAWPVDACVALFEAARRAGHPIRVHADQFNDLGMTARAVELGARSADHLEASTPETLALLGRSNAAGVLLPVSGFHLDDRYADGRALIDRGGAVVVATNWNPGSAPSPSIPFAVALAVRKNGLTPAEALTAVTWNAARLLDLPDRGWIGVGARADLVLLRERDEREWVHTVGGNAVGKVIVDGLII